MAVYFILPYSSNNNPEVRQQYINGHFCYVLKASILTNGLGIIQHISFFDNELIILKFLLKNLAILILIKKFQTLNHWNLYLAIFLICIQSFLGNSAFGSYDNYSFLRNTFHFDRVCTPINPRNSKTSEISPYRWFSVFLWY